MHCKDEKYYCQFIDTNWYQSEFRWLALGDRGSLVASWGVNLCIPTRVATIKISFFISSSIEVFFSTVCWSQVGQLCKVRKDDHIIKPMKSDSELLNSTLRTGSNFCVTLGKSQFYIYKTEIIFHSLPPNTFIKRLQLLTFYSNNRKWVMIMHN